MKHDNSPKPVTGLTAFFAGAVLGGVVIALTTPKRGAELRKDLNRLGAMAKDQIDEWAETASEAMKVITESGKNKSDSTGQMGKGWSSPGQ